jgi:hypothetical protein
MKRATIFQKNNIPRPAPEEVKLILSLNNSLVDLTELRIHFENDRAIIHELPLKFSEKDDFTITHIGRFESGKPFRLIIPRGISLELIKSKYCADGAFSIGSLDHDGYAIAFILTDPSDFRQIEVITKGNDEQIEKLIRASSMALNAGLEKEFILFTKRILKLIENQPNAILGFDNGEKVIAIMKANPQLYSFEERLILSAL